MRAAELNYHAWSDASTYVLHVTVNRIYDSRERRKCMQILHSYRWRNCYRHDQASRAVLYSFFVKLVAAPDAILARLHVAIQMITGTVTVAIAFTKPILDWLTVIDGIVGYSGHHTDMAFANSWGILRIPRVVKSTIPTLVIYPSIR